MELIRARLLLDGHNSSGLFAHEADVSFLNDIRYFRNSVTYYGKILDTEYAKKSQTLQKIFIQK
jgi:hypothetical protein